ncbi:MAG: molybdopterin biosynthesis protein [Eubacteriales bacterium]
MDIKNSHYKYLQNTQLEAALSTYMKELKLKGRSLESEIIPVQDSMGRITAKAVYANISSPHYNASAMDGIALMAINTFGATDTTPIQLEEGKDFCWVDTGDPLPDAYDAVVMVEDVIKITENRVQLISAATPWQHVRQIGEDICASEMILPTNIKVEPAAIGAMLAGGVLQVEVWKKPIVGLIPTGDEIVSPRNNPQKGEIIEFNAAIFSAMLQQWGTQPKIYEIVPDQLETITSIVKTAVEECDVIILNAGSSAGREDYASTAIEQVGEVITHGIAIRPGKPTILGIVEGKPVLGIPGYPVSGMIVMEKLCRQVIENLIHMKFDAKKKKKAILSRRIVSSLKYKEFVRMKLGMVKDRLITTPLNRGAGVVTSFVKADALLEIPLDTEGYEAGEEVEVEMLKNEDTVYHTLVVNGSHDPLLDIVYDILRKSDANEFLSSAHVGSMGGIMAIKRGEAHVAGIHLLDEHDGTYNLSYLRRYFPENNVILIKGVKRIQGLMIQKGNPKGIKTLDDITKEKIKYVNRQKGSGTRILLDYLLDKHKLHKSTIYGYEREEYTHMAVAALVDSGSADVGMGIYSASHIYGLEFIPLYQEDYDFIILKSAYALPIVQNFINILKSTQFKEGLSELGGYEFSDTGEIIEWM